MSQTTPMLAILTLRTGDAQVTITRTLEATERTTRGEVLEYLHSQVVAQRPEFSHPVIVFFSVEPQAVGGGR